MSKETPQVLKGFRDYLPQEQAARKKIISKISETFERFGFAPIDTPALESYSLLQGVIGEEEKLIYKFKDLGDREVALRYDLTVPLARVVANYQDLPKPFKRYQIANVWRAENPQKGRYREFMQCDVDIIGSNSLLADAEVVATLAEGFRSLNIGEVIVKYNNRQIIDKVLAQGKNTAKFLRIVDKYDKIGEKKIVAMLADEGFDITLGDFRSQMQNEAKDFIYEFEKYLSGLGVKNFVFDPLLARGLDYYTGTVFEFVLKEKPEFGSVAGGGRYDNLIGKISGKEMPAVGGSIGLDRLFAALSEAGRISPQTAAEVMIFNLDESLVSEYLKLASTLRANEIDAEVYYDTAKLDKQFKYAESKNSQVAVIMGPDEAKKGKVNLKNLKNKEQVTVDTDEVLSKIKSMLW